MQIESPSIQTLLVVSGSVVLTEEGKNSLVNQITSSLDTLYTVSGSITQADWDTLNNKPVGIVSSSNQINNSTLSGMTVSGSFSGSFQGDGSGLTGAGVSEVQTVLLSQVFS